MASAYTSPPPGATAILRSSYGSASVSKSWAMPCRPSTSTNSVRRPSVARASASAAATVVLPVPPLPLTTMEPAHICEPNQFPFGLRTMLPGRGITVGTMTKWEYATVPLLVHATKQILDTWGEDGWELVQVVPGPNNSEQLVAYLKREKGA